MQKYPTMTIAVNVRSARIALLRAMIATHETAARVLKSEMKKLLRGAKLEGIEQAAPGTDGPPLHPMFQARPKDAKP